MLGLLFALAGIIQTVAPTLAATAHLNTPSSPSTWSIDELMELIAKNKSNEVRFEETMFSDVLSKPLKSSGTLRFTPPSRLEKHVTDPVDERYVIEGNHVLLEAAGSREPQRLALDDYPSLRGFVEAFRASLSGDTAVLKQFYSTDLKGDRQRWTLTLRPIDQSVQALIKEIHLSGADGTIGSMTLYAANGDHSVLTMSGKRP